MTARQSSTGHGRRKAPERAWEKVNGEAPRVLYNKGFWMFQQFQ